MSKEFEYDRLADHFDNLRKANKVKSLEAAFLQLVEGLEFYGDSSKWQELKPDLVIGNYYKEGEAIYYKDEMLGAIICEGGTSARTLLQEHKELIISLRVVCENN